MRVLVVTPWFPSPAHRESGIFNLRDARLVARDHEVRVLHLLRPDWYDATESTARMDGLDVVRVPFSVAAPGTWYRTAAALRAALREAELLHTMAAPALLPFALRRVRIPWVHTEHFSTLVTPVSRPVAVALGMLSTLFRRPGEVVAVSAALARVIDAHRTRPASVIGNEVMLPIDAVPAGHDFEGRIRLIGVGGLLARKGPLEAVDALAALVERGVDAELVWAGDGELRTAMVERARASGVGERLTLLGAVSPDELSRELLRATMFLLPVETETFGVAIAEALTHGLPVVTSGTGGHEEFLEADRSRRVAERSGAALADAVQDLITDRGLPSRATIARQAAERFSESARADGYRRVYANAIAQG